MPVRNEASFIRQSVETLRRQDYPMDRMEVIIADGLSDDGTTQVLAELATADPRVRVVQNPGQIVPTGLNIAIQSARGEVVIRVDGHCELDRSFIRESVAVLREHPEAWSVGGPIVHAGRSPMGRAIAVAMSHPLGVGNAAHRFEGFEGYAEGAQFPAYHHWVFDRVGLFDERLVRNQDDELNFRINQAGGKVYVSPRIRYAYYVRENLRQLFRQYFQYGFWRIPVMKKHRRPTTLRQLVPSLFYLMMITLAIAGAITSSLLLALFLPTAYILSLLVVGLAQVRKVGAAVGIRVPPAIGCMHAAYAAGLAYGWLMSFLNPGAWSPAGRHTILSR